MPIAFSERDKAVDDLASKADLPTIAEELGVRVIDRRSSQPRALCPFHDDRTPSMTLYPAKGPSRAQFHCFACNAHGDVFDLIKKQLSCDFPAALQWLSQRMGVTLPKRRNAQAGGTTDPRLNGLQLAEEAYKNQSSDEAAMQAAFAEARGFDPKFLHQAGVFGVAPGKLATLSKTRGRETRDSLEAAGLVVRPRPQKGARGELTLPLDLAIDFFRTPRVLFTIRDERARIVGFAGRAILEKDTPKYLFSSGFPRGKTLYRLDKVRSRFLNRETSIGTSAELFVTEGLLDALRLEALGFDSTSIFGAHMTAEQIEIVSALAQELDRNGIQLVVHLFLDADEAGRRGTLTTLTALMAKSAATTGFIIDVIAPPDLGRKQDPDELLHTASDTANARQMLYGWAYSPMHVLLAAAVGCEPSQLEQVFNQMSPSSKMRSFRDVERRLDRAQWLNIFDRIEPWSAWRGVESDIKSERSWEARLRAFLTSAGLPHAKSVEENIVTPEKDEENKLSRALHIAQSSTQRRELPVDEGSWDRLKAAIDVTVPYLKELLENAAPLDELMIAVIIPKPNGGKRLKALPCPEFLTLQQYILNELVRDYPESPRFRECIPAVRYTASAEGMLLETTGIRDSTAPPETVSFAYQIDMDVVTGRIPPGRDGMFRPYYPCWENFIAFIDRRVRACGFERFHVARLDIRKYYDSLPRSAVIDSIFPGVRNALRDLEDRYDDGALQCARLFSPETKNADERAQLLVDWLCDQSFNFAYEDPQTGLANRQSHGLPQGPDLSAYLANIALFPVDCALREMIAQLDVRAQKDSGGNKLKRGGVYARYVDDMVIVAPTAHDLARLRAAIEEQLGRLGLDLSPKTEPLPSMSESELREWLTSRRGAGLGVSGPFEGPPVNEPLSPPDPLGDAGEIDRGKSLVILHDSGLESPETPGHHLREAVAIARQAEELRHADLVKAATLLWRAALRLDDDSMLTMKEGTERFLKFWTETTPVLDVPQSSETVGIQSYMPAAADVLCWLDGLHRLISSRPDRSPEHSSLQRQKLDKFRRHVAHLIQGGLCEEVTKLIPKEKLDEHRHMFDLRCLTIFSAASITDPTSDLAKVPWMQGPYSAAKSRMLITIAQAHGKEDLLAVAQLHASSDSERLIFHEAIARLIIGERSALENTPPSAETKLVDPLEPIRHRLDIQRRLEIANSQLTQILALWLPNFEFNFPLSGVTEAVAGLAQLAPTNLRELLDRRQPLTRAILGGNVHWQGRIIAIPPGMSLPGLLGVTTNQPAEAIRIQMREIPEGTCPPDLEWHDEQQSISSLGWQRSRAPLNQYRLLLPLKRSEPFEPQMLKWLASAFRGLAKAHDSHAKALCPPTAGNLIGPDIGERLNPDQWNVLGFCIPVEKLNGWAFIRHEQNSLVAEAIPEQDDYLWRIGTALADRLGRLESSSSLLQMRLQARANVTDDTSNWAGEAMLRFSLFRLRGRPIPKRRFVRATGSQFPATIVRVLARLERFPTGGDVSETVQLAHLLATIAEGRALHAHTKCTFDPSLPGGATTLLIDLVRPQFNGDEELAQRLPKADRDLPSWMPKRRPAFAWLSLSMRLEQIVAHDSEGHSDLTLSALVVGTRLLAVEAQLRSQALERWGLLSAEERHMVLLTLPKFDPSALLHRDQGTGQDQVEAGDNVNFLFQKLIGATAHGNARFGSLAGITPLGWALILGRLTEALPEEGIPREAAQWFESVETLLSCRYNESNQDLPWGGLELLITALNKEALGQLFAALSGLDSEAGIFVNVQEDPHFKMVPHRGGVIDVSIPSVTLQLDTWKISWANVPGEPSSGTESFRVALDDRFWFRWSETRLGDRLLSIGLVQPQLASLAGISAHEVPDTTPSEVSPPRVTLPAEEALETKQSLDPSNFTRVITDESNPSKAAPVPKSFEVPRKDRKPLVQLNRKKDSPLRRIELLQDENWSRRRHKSRRHARVAIFQWKVDDSYRHPLFEACTSRKDSAHHGLVSQALKNPELWNHGSHYESCAEHRRRGLLKAALRACNNFGVDILLLPEYSIRADTAYWLKENLALLAPKTSIWAGTYRNAPGSVLKVFEDPQPQGWTAILPVILSPTSPGGPIIAIPRRKKYPAVAVGEFFNPVGSQIEPIFEPTSPNFDARAYVWELICSEIFLTTSPSNLHAMAKAHGDLLRQFGIHAKSEEDLVSLVKKDLGILAKETSLSDSVTPPRLIHLIPAMTRRAVDYSISGQASFLASGITTVFCNAAHKKLSKGQSCIIGHDSWGRDTDDSTGMPSIGPYHNLKPGIYNPSASNFGPLGEFEQALVIADIDPVYSMEGKPRPQMLPPPLALVAHLPIIESWGELKKHTKHSVCVCGTATDRTEEVHAKVSKLLEAIKAAGAVSNTSEDKYPAVLAEAIKSLAELASTNNESWMHKRVQAYLNEHAATPTMWPPPCALDWLWVDHDLPTTAKLPTIEMPAYSNKPR